MTTPTTSCPPARGEAVTLTAHTMASITEVLAISEEFLRTASPIVHAELRGYLAHRRPPADPAWFLDVLSFTGSHLHHQLAAQSPTTAPPSENWHHPHPDDHEQVCR